MGKTIIQVQPQAVSDALEAATAIQDRRALLRLRSIAKRNKKLALQYACIDHVLTGQPLQLLHRTDPAKPNSYDMVQLPTCWCELTSLACNAACPSAA
jgi:hypothetical protein